MNRKHQLIVIGLTVLTLCSVVSHLVARGLHLRTQAVAPLFFGDTNQQDTATVAGSSLTFYGIEWHAVAQRLKAGMTGLGVPAGSVHELEILQRNAPPVRYTFLGVSMFDLNENYLSDFRADIVPMGEAIKSLQESHSSWAYRKRVLSQYPMKYIRSLFPTAGRSVTVMVGVREKLRTWLKGEAATKEKLEQAVVSSESNPHQDSIQTWPADRRMRNIMDLRSNAGGHLEFQGQKRHSLLKFLNRGVQQGRVVLIILPESPTFRAELVTPADRGQFEAALTEAQRAVPDLVCVRLDQVKELDSDGWYWDIVHLNAPGQAVATRVLIEQLSQAGLIR
ncbi:MAG: hypothetical protein HOP33_22505 [Verrucomicrobia bacterium]|nr:hypothetical protein [Verrucomicrobiota bacterium]